MATHNEIGALGEDIATNFLKQKGLQIVTRNYRKKYGEIDIVARENDLVRFVEVKAVSYETEGGVPYGTHRPEENVHPQKIKRLQRVVQAYLISHETERWVFDVVCVYINRQKRTAKVKWLKDIVLS